MVHRGRFRTRFNLLPPTPQRGINAPCRAARKIKRCPLVSGSAGAFWEDVAWGSMLRPLCSRIRKIKHSDGELNLRPLWSITQFPIITIPTPGKRCASPLRGCRLVEVDEELVILLVMVISFLRVLQIRWLIHPRCGAPRILLLQSRSLFRSPASVKRRKTCFAVCSLCPAYRIGYLRYFG